MTIADEFRSRNFSIYGQWAGVLCIVLCFALGIANFFNLGHILLVIFAVLCLASSFIILFIEIPLLLRICPTSPTFDNFIRRFETNYMRAGIYGVMSLIQWLSLTITDSSLIAAAVVLLIAACMYLFAGIKGQQFQSSKTLGGQGVAQMIV
ncbi:Golgi apparatus membrane protein tvp18 [Saxophila tyrrhenica]|uniref:Golgi apparatus membrane protein tvp18 n=1 Tax=Saxophila tyrrhenica TaxID=1690608 RepID=A0AAV9PBH9_9PEZI|nr:Golgi apparatus membrane protein tvp18 [Saxophila tyrrhenica]